MWEASLDGPREGNPYLDVELSFTFRQHGDGVTVPGFYDGDGVYRVRFSPPAQGEWRYETRSNRPELNGKSGSFTAVDAVRRAITARSQVFKTFYLRYADGTPYHQFGTTCYAWVHQTRELQEQTLKTLAASPFNKIRFCVFPKSYTYNQNEPEFFAFQKGADGKFDFSRPDPAFWRHFEQRILDLQKLGIEADLILWHPYDRWGFADMSDAEDDRYLRYCIARLSAYPQRLVVAGQRIRFHDRPAAGPSRQQAVGGLGPVLLDPAEGRPAPAAARHSQRQQVWYDHTKAWVTHASLQTSDMNGGVRFREQYQQAGHLRRVQIRGQRPAGLGQSHRAR